MALLETGRTYSIFQIISVIDSETKDIVIYHEDSEVEKCNIKCIKNVMKEFDLMDDDVHVSEKVQDDIHFYYIHGPWITNGYIIKNQKSIAILENCVGW